MTGVDRAGSVSITFVHRQAFCENIQRPCRASPSSEPAASSSPATCSATCSRFAELARASRSRSTTSTRERLETAEAMARWTSAAARRRAPQIEAHLDRRAALDGADFAINMIQVGGYAATLLDFEIPARYGLRQTIGDTLGIGGIFRALRTIPVMLGIGARHGRARAPTRGCSTTRTRWRCSARPTRTGSPHTKIVGLCHSVQHTTRTLAELRRRPVRGGHVPRRGRQPPGVHPALRARRRGPLPAARRARSRPTRSCSATCASSMYRRLRLLPDRVERALRRVRALVHARRRRDRALPHPGRRVRAPQRGEPRPSTSDLRDALRERRAASRSSAASSTRR